MRCFVPDESVDAAVLAIAVGIDVSIAFSRGGFVAAATFAGSRVVLDDKVIPIGDPEIAIGSDFGGDGGEPFIGGGDEGEVVLGMVACAFLGGLKFPEEVTGGAADEGGVALP